MPKLLTSGAERLLENFVKFSGSKCAVYNGEMKLLQTNYHQFFDNFDLTQLFDPSALASEGTFTVETNGVHAVLSVSPIYKSQRVIAAYICIIREAYDIYKMISKSVISDFSDNIMKKNGNRLETLAQLNRAVTDSLAQSKSSGAKKKLAELLQKQKKLIDAMKNETKFYLYTCFNDVEKMGCNISLLFSQACEHVSEYLRETGRRVNYTAEEKDYYIEPEGGPLLLGFMHLLRAHLILSPKKTSVSITALYEDSPVGSGTFTVKLKTKLLSKENSDEDLTSNENIDEEPTSMENTNDEPLSVENADDEPPPIEYADEDLSFQEDTYESLLISSRAYRELAKKVVVYDYGGDFNCHDSKKYMQTIFKIPVGKKNRRAVFKSVSAKYDSLDISYLEDIVYLDSSRDSEE